MPTLQINDLRKQLNQPLYAVAGASEVALDYARAYVAETQDRLVKTQDRIAKADLDPQALSSQARTVVNARVDELTKDAKAAQARFEARVAELQKDAAAFPGKVQVQFLAALTELVRTYAELADRGEKFVAAIRKDGVKAMTAVKDAPKHSTVAHREAQKTAAAKRDTADSTAKKAPATRKSTARKSTARKSPASKTTASKSTASKSTARKSTARKSTASKSTTAKSTASPSA
ncbi:MAG TPA: hypothetical protein VFM09_00015 [Marmoricola sp.]|nr:hypothetical protein [Marmoricola sp.]